LIVEILVTLLFALGLFYVLSGVLGIPPFSSARAIRKLTEEKKPLKEKFKTPIITMIEPFVRLTPYHRKQLNNELLAAGINKTPEAHIAQAIVSAGLYMLVGLIVLPKLPLGTAALTVYSVTRFFKDRKVKNADSKKHSIEAEAPRFTSYFVQSLTHRQDLAGIIQDYRKIAGKELGNEIDILLTDMRTGNHEAALIAFECRINSSLVSELVRGLIGLEHGEDMKSYLISVEARMNEHEIAELKKAAAKRPDLLAPANFLLLGCIIVIYLSVLGIQFVSSLKYINF
jgi:tight adherence protein C